MGYADYMALPASWCDWKLQASVVLRHALSQVTPDACYSYSNLLHENTFWREEQQGHGRKMTISNRLSFRELWKMQLFHLCRRILAGSVTYWFPKPFTYSAWLRCSLAVPLKTCSFIAKGSMVLRSWIILDKIKWVVLPRTFVE
jgi:hypothetical protein